MVSALLGASTFSFRSLLSLALMPLSLLLACALVAGLGAVILLFTRASEGWRVAESIALPSGAAPPATAEPQPVRGHAERRAGSHFTERRQSSAVASAEQRLDQAIAAISGERAADSAPTDVPAGTAPATHGAARAANPIARELHGSRPQDRKRAGSPYQPGSRFARSQQAFLRIPVVVAGRNDSGADFREETCTLILLPQGAVLPLAQRLAPGGTVSLHLAGKPQLTCSVFSALLGPDGKSLAEIEFTEPQRNFWPVSFPAWAGELPANRERRNQPAPLRPALRSCIANPNPGTGPQSVPGCQMKS
jgi:hypothetical protein